MKKQTVGLFLVAFLIGQVFVNLDLSKIRAAEVESEASISASQVAQAVLDDSLKVEDLSIKTPRLLPVSPFYFVKDFSRDIQKFFTFDSVKKAELELRFADERLMEVRILAETRPEKQDALKNALELYQNQTNELKDRLENLASKSKNPNIDKLLEKVTDRAIKHEKLFDELISNTKLSDTAKDKIKATQGVYLDVVSAVSKKFDTPTEFSDRLEKVVGSQVQTGSEFNSIRVLEVIDRLETKLPEEVRAKTASIREDLLSQIKVAINETSVTPATSGQILNALPGDKISRAKIMGEIKESEAQSKVKMNSRLEAVAEEFGDGIKDNITKERAALAIKSAETRIGELRRALGISLVKAVPFMDMNGKYVINQNSSNLTLLPGTPIPSGNQGGIPVTVTGTTPIGGANPAPVTPVSTGLYGDKNKALEFLKKAEEKLAEAKQAFNQEKFGEAFGKAVSAEAHARSGLRALAGGEGADSLQGSLEKLINKLNNIKEKIKNLGWTSENKPEVFSLISQAENLLKQAQSLLENKRPDLIDILRQAKEIIFKLERLIKEKPIPSISNTVSGVLAPAGPNIYQWGTHQLKTEGGKIFQVKALNDSVLADLKKYENQQVRIYGKAQFYEIEG